MGATEHVTYCRICEPLCGMVATVEDGRVTKLRPDKDHPLSRGFACPKGVAMAEVQNDPDRVPFDFTELIACLAPRPFFTNSPLKDGNFEVSGVRDVIEAASPIYRLYGQPENLVADYPDYGHDFTDESREKAYRFLEQHLSGKKLGSTEGRR